ncbi:phage tail tape measure protein [Undibacterium sp.]|uniref:phage tail tape measure protein n=1 Tax=Undibacterium sp. TaxID=1914977 RepID=UPI0025E6A101|nr:phage tail tape measure protein [Undibacterium sp.]
MSKNLQLSLTMMFNGSAVTTGLTKAGASVKQFTTNAGRNLGAVRREVGLLYKDFNGFSAISKMVVAAGGMSIAKSILTANMEFEKTLLESKQLANMTKAQAAEMRASAIKQSTNLLATPQEIAEGMKVLANAGMKFEQISGTIAEAGRAALLFRSSITDVANMDFDIQTKFKIDPSEMKKAHEMLYYHSKDGRFEAKSLSAYAPVYLNDMKNVGIGGMGGLNFAGAITQSIQQAAPATQPGEVATMIKQGLSHIYSEHIGKKLQAETGIDIKKFTNNEGKFKGKDGVDGIMDLAIAMKAAGLDNQFKLQKAGFREQESRTFWLQLMNNAKEMKEKMKAAEGDASANLGDKDVEEIKGSNYGKVKKLDIESEKGKVGETATQGVDFVGRSAEYIADHKNQVVAAGAATAGLYLLNRFNKNRKARIGADAQAASSAAQAAASAAAIQQVFITNWPAGMQAPGEALKQKRNNRGGVDVPGADIPGGVDPSAKPQSKWGKVLGGAGKAIGALGAVTSGWEIGYNVIGPVVNKAIDSLVSAIAGHDTTLGGAIYDMLHKEPIPISVQVDVKNGNIVASVTSAQDKKASRY